MQVTPEQVFFSWCDKNSSNFKKSDLWRSRLVCRKWNTEISKNPPIYHKLLRYKLHKLLYYDKAIYDEHYVRRLIISKKLTEFKYDLDLIPTFALLVDDLDDNPEEEYDIITTLLNNLLPLEFRTFLELYREFPSDKIRIYSPDFMSTVAHIQGTLIRNTFLTHGAEEVNKMITIHPFCYSKHYKGDITDIQYINVLCYLNVIGEYGESTDNNRYFILILELDNLQDDDTHRKLLMNHINVITTNVYMNWDYLEDLDLQPFTIAVETLIKQQKFNF
jgi:hypothetical protein